MTLSLEPSIMTAGKEHEKQLLGSLMLDGSWLDHVELQPKHFGEDAHARILDAMLRLKMAGKPTGVEFLVSQLRRTNDLEAVGGTAYIVQVFTSVVNAAHVVYHADEVLKAYQLRQAAALVEEMQRKLRSGRSGDEVIDTVKLRTMEWEAEGSFRKRVEIPTIGKLIDQNPNLRPPIVEGLFRLGETSNIVAASKVGKSWLGYGLAFSVACGGRWLGRFTVKAGNVLYVDNELHRETLANRLSKVADALGIPREAWDDRISVLAMRGINADLASIGDYLGRWKPGTFNVVIVDALYRALPRGTDENSNGQMTQVFNLVDSIAERHGVSFVLIHHSSKGSQAGKAITDVGSGAGAMSRATDTHLVLRQHQEDGVAVLEAVTRSFQSPQPFCLRFDYPLWVVDESLDPKQLKDNSPRRGRTSAAVDPKPQAERIADEFLALLKQQGPLSKTKLKTLAHCNSTVAGDALDLLIEQGRIEVREKSSGNKTWKAFSLVDLPLEQPGLGPHPDQSEPRSDPGSEEVRTRTRTAPIRGVGPRSGSVHSTSGGPFDEWNNSTTDSTSEEPPANLEGVFE